MVFSGKIEVEESYFGGKRKGKRGRGAARKVPVFWFLKRGGKVFTKVISDAWSETLLSAKLCQTVSSIQAVGEVTTCWMYLHSSISVSIIPNRLQTRKITSTGSTISARKPSAICASLMVLRRNILGYF